MVPPLSQGKTGAAKARHVFSSVSLFAAEDIIERQSRFQEGGLAMAKGEGSDGRNDAGHTSEGHDAGEDAALRARLSRLSNALDQHQNPAASDGIKVPELSGQELSASNLGFRVLVEFLSAILVGTLIGWQIDKWAHTGPIFLVIFLLLGMVAGLVNIYRIAAGPKPPRAG